MITLDKIRGIRRIVTHDHCADGLASAILARAVCPDAEIVFLQHGTPEHRELPATPGTLFSDFAPPADRVQEFIDAGTIVLDHHKTQRAIVEAFGDNAVFGDEITQPGVCGATLVYEHIWKPWASAQPVMPSWAPFVAEFARLAGVRDTWQRKDPQWHEAGIQHATLTFFPASFWLMPEKPLSTIASDWSQYRWIGEIQVAKHEDRVSHATTDAYRFTSSRGTRVACFEGVRLSSDAAERLDKEVDLVIGFGHRLEEGTPRLNLSTRSHTDFDCAAFARYYGGGGHTRAAGCSLPFDVMTWPNPFLAIRQSLDKFEMQGKP